MTAMSAASAANFLSPAGSLAVPPTQVSPLMFNLQSPAPPGSYFSQLPAMPTSYTAAQQTAYLNLIGLTYDTWALSYERDGINQNGGATIDEGTDGIDSDGKNGVDDVGERETVPPYSYPLRGLQIKIRFYEPGTRQVRQATVGTDFISE
jgi:hypothetical protein